jgi:hypothetical protein
MQNITVNVEGDKLVLTVDLSQEIGPSSSGETALIASTEGNANVPGHAGVKVGLRPPLAAARLVLILTGAGCKAVRRVSSALAKDPRPLRFPASFTMAIVSLGLPA